MNTLTQYFKSARVVDAEPVPGAVATAVEAMEEEEDAATASETGTASASSANGNGSVDIPAPAPVTPAPAAPVPAPPLAPRPNDIGQYIGKVLDDATRFMLLENPWMPPPYKLPETVHVKPGGTEVRSINHQKFQQFPWLVYSEIVKGYFCKYCVLFAAETGASTVRNNNARLGKLVKEPLQSCAKLPGKDGVLTIHDTRTYHYDCIMHSKDFKDRYLSPNLSVENLVDQQHLQQIQENRQKLRPMVETVLLCGRYNLPLRGHRDDGPISRDEPGKNDGVFRGLLRSRMRAGDSALEEQCSASSQGPAYSSKTVQNEIIDCCREEMQENILKRVRDAEFYAVIFDETTDISHIEQLSLSLRYLHKVSECLPNGGRKVVWKVREDFVTFVDAYQEIRDEDIPEDTEERRLSGEALGHVVVDLLRVKLMLDLNKNVGTGTDNCSVMASILKGAAVVIARSCPNAVRCPCSNHALNSSLCKTTDVVPLRNAIGIMKKVISFSTASAKRNAIF